MGCWEGGEGNMLPIVLSNVIKYFESLPGIGPKTAQGLAFYCAHLPDKKLISFGENLKILKKSVKLCDKCFSYIGVTGCDICKSKKRDKSLLCVVESVSDLIAIEKIGNFKGIYHVLHGAISPLEDIGPDEIKIVELKERVKMGKVKEIILATNPNMEGEATAMYIKREIKKVNPNCKITRLGQGLPIGAQLELSDDRTLNIALENRKEY